jgi:hypothetical protein
MPGAWLEGVAWCDCVFLRGGRANCVEGLSSNRDRGVIGNRSSVSKASASRCCHLGAGPPPRPLPVCRGGRSLVGALSSRATEVAWVALYPEPKLGFPRRLGRSQSDSPSPLDRSPGVASSVGTEVPLACVAGRAEAQLVLRPLRPKPLGEWKPIGTEARQVSHLDAEAPRCGRPVEVETSSVE